MYGGKQDAEEIKKYRHDIRFDLAMRIQYVIHDNDQSQCHKAGRYRILA